MKKVKMNQGDKVILKNGDIAYLAANENEYNKQTRVTLYGNNITISKNEIDLDATQSIRIADHIAANS